ncbi:MAG: TIGR00282 family metallophosphoesterase, partial [Oscillospiraceae bacterium]
MANICKILAIGDVVGEVGCEKVRAVLPNFKIKENIDICIANGENSATGNGLTPYSAEHLFASGVDFITGGNHIFRRHEVYETLDSSLSIIRPANYIDECPGKGYGIIDKGSVRVGVINMLGTVYLEPLRNPFLIIDKIVDELKKEVKIILLDFHAEATGEKRGMGFYLDGKISAMFGTHTHVQTADEQILPLGTGYITDLGMTGPIQSVLGVDAAVVIEKM